MFSEQPQALQASLTDEAIDRALHTWPKAIYDLDAMAFKKELDKRDWLTEPLEGSDKMAGHPSLITCFECDDLLGSYKEK